MFNADCHVGVVYLIMCKPTYPTACSLYVLFFFATAVQLHIKWSRAYSKENFGLHRWRLYGEHGARAYNGGLGAEPLVRGSEGVGRSPPEADSILAFEC